MKILAISGSGRRASTNSAMLRAMSSIVRADHQVTVFDRIGDLPIFSPDLESFPLPKAVQELVRLVGQNDGLIIASPEYVKAIPGGLKNAIDWLVSRNEITAKPIALMHASHRGDDMLNQLRVVLSTVSMGFHEGLFLRFNLMKKSPEEIEILLGMPQPREEIAQFVHNFTEYCLYRAFKGDVASR